MGPGDTVGTAGTGGAGADGVPPVRVLIVDDSAVVRGSLGRTLDAEPDLKVVTTATNGRQALEALRAHPADVVVLDVEMPEMDGLAALPLILKQHPGTRVLMLSAHGGRGADVTVRALALGAADFVCKPRAGGGTPGPLGTPSRAAVLDTHAAELTRKIRALGRSAQRAGKPPGRPPTAPALVGTGGAPPLAARPPVGPAPAALPPRRAGVPTRRPAQVLAVASSTGGPVALAEFFGALPPLGVPVLVTQHMPPDFTRLLAERLATTTVHPCAEARDGEALRPGHVYVAPGDHHLVVERARGEVRVRLTHDAPVHHCRPAADPMFAAAAAAYGPGVLAVVLTGMGCDGRDGAATIVRRGGRVLAQDEATSVVWGMPGAVAQAGLADAVLPIPQLAAHVAACCPRGPAGRPAAALPVTTFGSPPGTPGAAGSARA